MLGAAQPLSALESFRTLGVEVVDLNADGIEDFVIAAGANSVRTLQGDASLGMVPFESSMAVLTQVPGMDYVAALGLSAIPQPNGAVPALAGTLWFFQAWYRDSVAGQPTSNFSDALAVVFQ